MPSRAGPGLVNGVMRICARSEAMSVAVQVTIDGLSQLRHGTPHRPAKVEAAFQGDAGTRTAIEFPGHAWSISPRCAVVRRASPARQGRGVLFDVLRHQDDLPCE